MTTIDELKDYNMKKKITKKLSKADIAKLNKAEAARIKKANAIFAKFTPAQKRVMIAEDVLAQMAIGYIKPESRVWAAFNKGMPKGDSNMEMQDFLNKQKSCNACGLGSLFICAVKRFDDLKISTINNNSKIDIEEGSALEDGTNYCVTVKTIFSYLKKFFSQNQLEMIESAFEEGNGWVDDHLAEVDSSPGKEYFRNLVIKLEDMGYNDLITAELKMKLIMQNIIKNKGTFKFDKNNMPKINVTVSIQGF